MLVCASSKVHRALNGHMRWCKSHQKVKRALVPEEVRAPPPFCRVALLREAEDNEFHYDVEEWATMDQYDRDAVQDHLDELHERKYGCIKPNMQVNGGYLIFQNALKDMYDSESGKNPMRTGWIRGEHGETTAANWEDYALINRFCVRNGLSIASGDELLLLITDIARRQNVHISIPRTMKAVRYVPLCTLMFFVL